jgi:methionyl-tRNA formyltransferase
VVRLVFLGTPEFAVPSLEACLNAGHEVVGVFTQPDRPKGRGNALTASPVKSFALSRDLPVFQPQKVRESRVIADLKEKLQPEIMVVVGYGQIIPQAIIDIPKHGILNVHASLLPEYRGAAPIQRCIADGAKETGVTIMKIEAGLDTGDIFKQVKLSIGPAETAEELSLRLAKIGAAALVDVIANITSLQPVKQDDSRATVAPQLKKEEGLVSWTFDAQTIFNRCRGFQPWPGCYTTFRDRILNIYKCIPSDEALVAEPGTIVGRRKRLFVACGHSTTLELLEVQMEGRRRASAADFLNGQRIGENEILGSVERRS